MGLRSIGTFCAVSFSTPAFYHSVSSVVQSAHLHIFGQHWLKSQSSFAMLTESKIKELRKSLRSGVPDGEIRNEMARDGYSEEEINQVFAPYKADMRSWYLVFGCVFLIAGFWAPLIFVFSAVMFYLYYEQVKKTNPDDRVS